MIDREKDRLPKTHYVPILLMFKNKPNYLKRRIQARRDSIASCETRCESNQSILRKN